MKWLKKGPKYNPYVKKEVSTYLKDFDLQFTESLKRVIKYYKGLRSDITFVLHPAKIEATIRGILSKNKNKNLDKVLRKLLSAYILQRRLYNQNIRKLVNTSNTGDVINGSQLDDIFPLNDGRIIVSADKNLGCCIMEIEHYRQQYDIINNQQHFGKVELDENLYIVQILDYLKYMQKNIPRQLNKLVKPHDFDYDSKKANRKMVSMKNNNEPLLRLGMG